MKRSKKVAAGIAVLAIVGVSGLAFANGGFGGGGYHMGMGSGGHMMGYNGYDNHMGGGGFGDHMGYGDNVRGQRLSDEQREKIDQAREDIFKTSSEIRNNADQKRLDLRSEIAKENPDADKLRKIQKDLSGLVAELDQKRLDLELKISKIVPDSRRGYAGSGYGHRFGGHHMD
jgi:Spy/CpxP family protein refolding chaperone